MAKFGVTATLAAVAATDKSVAGIVASANKRVKLYDWMVGADGTPADNSSVVSLQDMDATAAGTSTAVTPKPLDPGDPASDTTATEDYSVEPTADSGIASLEVPINIRASYRWVAAPGSELVIAATVNLKYVSQVRSSAYTGTVRHTVLFEE